MLDQSIKVLKPGGLLVEVAEAHRTMAGGRIQGKLVLDVTA